MKVQRIMNPFLNRSRVYDAHKLLQRVYDRVYRNYKPFHIPFVRFYEGVHER